MYDMNDNEMPTGWHQIKSHLLNEMCLAANFHHCKRIASALFHARLLGEKVAKENRRFLAEHESGQAESAVALARRR